MDEKMLNNELDFMTRANSKLNPLSPKPGLIFIGNNGVEFREEKGPGFIQIPWSTIVQIHVQMFFGGRYVRGFFIQTEEQLLEFIVSDAKDALKHMRRYLDRDVFIRKQSNIAQVLKRNK